MATSLGNGLITFGDNSTQNTASSYVGPRAQYFSANGTFTIPTGITSLKARVVSGGGGAGGNGRYPSGCGYIDVIGGYGGYGAQGIQWITGLTPGLTLTIVVGTAGAGGLGVQSGRNPGSPGNAGTTSSISSGTQSISTIQCTGGGAGAAGGTSPSQPAAAANGTATGFTTPGYSLTNLSVDDRGLGQAGTGYYPNNSGTAGYVIIEY